MRKLITPGLLGAAIMFGAAAPAVAGIEKFSSTPPGLILQGVSVPADAEMLYLSGQLADPIEPAMKSSDAKSIDDFGDTKTQTISTLAKIKKLLESKGYTMADVIKLTVFVAAAPGRADGRMDFAGMNEGFKQFFGTAQNPTTVARSTIQVAGLAGPYFLVEIEATAARMPR